MIVDIGGGTTEVALISPFTFQPFRTLRRGRTDDAIISMRRTYNRMVGERTAEDIKIRIGSAYPRHRNSLSRSRAATWSRAFPRQ